MKVLVKVNQLFSRDEPKTSLSKLIRFPLSRILIAIFFIAPIIALRTTYSFVVLDNLDGVASDIAQYAEVVVSIVLFFIVYRFYTKKVEKRSALELGTNSWYREFGQGIGIGAGLVIAMVVLLAILGFYKIEHLNAPDVLLSRVFRYGVGSFLEELLFTLIIFRLVEEFAGTIASMVVVSLLFGLMHLGNDNATLMSSACIAAGQIVLLAPFILTRRIWMGWAIHFGWNYFQTAVFGMNNSGMAHEGFIQPTISGPEWLTGGAFGIEASYIAIALNILVGAAILWYAVKQGQLVRAHWNRE